jgi:TPR repeat protein
MPKIFAHCGVLGVSVATHKKKDEMQHKPIVSAVSELEQKFEDCSLMEEDESDWEDMVSELALDDAAPPALPSTAAATTTTTAAATSSVLAAVAIATTKVTAELVGMPSASTEYLTHEAKRGCVTAQLELGARCKKAGDLAAAVAWFSQAVKQGSPAGNFELGLCYQDGTGVARNDARALTLIRAAAMAKYAPAQHEMGMLYEHGHCGLAKSAEHAVAFWKLSAAQGLPTSQYNLGICYDEGTGGLAKDEAKAAALWALAANQGMPDAKFNLGNCYMEGSGVERDHKKAAALFQEVVNINGDGDALMQLAMCYEKGFGVERDESKALALCKKAACTGDEGACARLGRYLINGVGGERNFVEAISLLSVCTTKDSKAHLALARTLRADELMKQFAANRKHHVAAEAVALYRLAAIEDNASAQVELGFFYMQGLFASDGTVIDRDWARAIVIFQKCKDRNAARYLAAARTGHADELMQMFRSSSEPSQVSDADAIRAVALYRLAADAGDGDAQMRLGLLYVQGSSYVGGRDWGRAAELLQLAATQEVYGAGAALGALYLDGLGVEEDTKQAAALFAKGHHNGEAVASRYLAMCYERGIGVPQDTAMAAAIGVPEMPKYAIAVHI